MHAHLLIVKPGYTFSLAQMPPTVLSRPISVTFVNPSERRTCALMRPAGPVPIIPMEWVRMGFRCVLAMFGGSGC